MRRPGRRRPTIRVLATGLVLALGTVAAASHAAPPTQDGPRDGDAVIPGELIVRFRSGHGPDDLDRATRGQVERSTAARSVDDLWLLEVPEAATAEVTDALRQQPHVAAAGPNVRLTTAVDPDPHFPLQWGLHNVLRPGRGAIAHPDVDIDAPEAWAATGGAGTVVAVIDTGVELDHPDLAANAWTNPAEANGLPNRDDDGNGYVDDVHGWDFHNDDATVYDGPDLDAHGTRVAGVVAADDDDAGVVGVAPGAQVMVLKVLEGSAGSAFEAIDAVAYATAMGADVINASWTTPNRITDLRDVIDTSGLPLVAAAGNQGVDADVFPQYPAAFDLPNVLSVTAVDPAGRLPGFANWGDEAVDVGAPGVDVHSTLPDGHGSLSGTSMAAPHVAGIAALYRALHPDAPGAAVVDQVRDTTRPLPALVGRTATGGMANAAATIGAGDRVLREGPRQAPVPSPAGDLPTVRTGPRSVG